ncbi:hypothetical protein [Bacillus smithii]|uniref:hypothetical protein n=1 Tax=Bacillus smithii TaxID=1479 RepID=UPI003D1DACC6
MCKLTLNTGNPFPFFFQETSTIAEVFFYALDMGTVTVYGIERKIYDHENRKFYKRLGKLNGTA